MGRFRTGLGTAGSGKGDRHQPRTAGASPRFPGWGMGRFDCVRHGGSERGTGTSRGRLEPVPVSDWRMVRCPTGAWHTLPGKGGQAPAEDGWSQSPFPVESAPLRIVYSAGSTRMGGRRSMRRRRWSDKGIRFAACRRRRWRASTRCWPGSRSSTRTASSFSRGGSEWRRTTLMACSVRTERRFSTCCAAEGPGVFLVLR